LFLDKVLVIIKYFNFVFLKRWGLGRGGGGGVGERGNIAVIKRKVEIKVIRFIIDKEKIENEYDCKKTHYVYLRMA